MSLERPPFKITVRCRFASPTKVMVEYAWQCNDRSDKGTVALPKTLAMDSGQLDGYLGTKKKIYIQEVRDAIKAALGEFFRAG